jgi:glycosyltransferase involved in cell wall biosynthesis
MPPQLADYGAYGKRRDADQPLTPLGWPQVSIITITMNAAATLERTIASVQAQEFPSIEQIFVDGGSADGTLDIIKSRVRPADYWISEKDKGISDAFNKGIALARGSCILILNADDWLSPDQIGISLKALEGSGADFVFGDLIFYQGETPLFRYRGDPAYARVIDRRWPSVGHPTLLATRSAYARAGLFDTAYRNAMDYDWLLRLHRAGGRGFYCSDLAANMTHDGVSNLQFRRTIEEVRQIVIAQGRNPILAGLEARFRYWKTRLSQPIKRHGAPLYRLIRRSINPSYKPITLSG